MIDESFNNKLHLLGCRLVSKGENRVKVACNGNIWDVVFSPAQYLPKKPGMDMSGYGHCDCEQQVITVNRDLPVPVQKYVVLHELTHCIGYPDESEAHLRATVLQPRALPYLIKQKGKQLTLTGLSALEKAPGRLERGMIQATERGATNVEEFLESSADELSKKTEYMFGIDRSRPRRTLGDEGEWSDVADEESTERIVNRLSGLSNIGRRFTPEW